MMVLSSFGSNGQELSLRRLDSQVNLPARKMARGGASSSVSSEDLCDEY